MTLQAGDRAPAFSLKDDNGQTVSLDQFKGKTVVLYFYPKDETPGCTREACDFRDSMTKFQRKDVVILGVSKDSVDSHKKFKNNHELPFPLLADENTEVCQKYGVWGERRMMGKKYMGIERTTFIIDKAGNVQHIWRGVKVEGHIEDILSRI